MKFTTAAVLALLFVPLAHASDFNFAYTREELVAPEELFGRLDAAVNTFCRQTYDLRSLGLRQQCQKDLVRITVEEIGHPVLTAYAENRTDGRSS